ncbi:Aldo/keto reductase [Tistlia consotensis]|uniref:Aldo/keto reductase n=1 Tax=Tistlia consotensis USBA 355 TaxID=560819 RepID=A0A1Y6BHN5_9PROT|nr:aldo/keto reductase [Tistlia consotensis]SMF01937.1 Aldo/keto reductase [Tistlia consotensis USBA 355]SNS26010.1 Aldo/keto reductase [Tistlia consotensis]
MRQPARPVTRRRLLAGLAAVAALAAAGLRGARAAAGPPITRILPATGEALPVIGMGSWITFNVGDDPALRAARVEVLRAFFAGGGRVIDSSPMYGSSEAVIGHCLGALGRPSQAFAATKVWTWRQSDGPEQMAESRALWGVERFDLMQVHNLLGWEGHLETLQADKAAGRLRAIGVTTSHGSRHAELERIMTGQPIDAVQFTYNLLDRAAEARLLPLAAERKLAVIVNRPFRRRELFRLFARHPLPGWAAELDCANWAQFLLKFVVSHPAVTVAIPATSRVDHMVENMGALYGRLPDQRLRRRMVDYVESL